MTPHRSAPKSPSEASELDYIILKKQKIGRAGARAAGGRAAGGRADGRTEGRTDGRTFGRTDERTTGRTD